VDSHRLERSAWDVVLVDGMPCLVMNGGLVLLGTADKDRSCPMEIFRRSFSHYFR
jgi:hypothetical protein